MVPGYPFSASGNACYIPVSAFISKSATQWPIDRQQVTTHGYAGAKTASTLVAKHLKSRQAAIGRLEMSLCVMLHMPQCVTLNVLRVLAE